MQINESQIKWDDTPTSKPDYEPFIAEASKTHNVEPELIKAMIAIESSGKSSAKSSKGAIGLMQLMPDTAKAMGVVDSTDPRQNIMGGTKYLAKQLKATNGDIPLALARYNAGPGNVKKHGGIPPFPETQGYIEKVQGRYNKNKGSQSINIKKTAMPDYRTLNSQQLQAEFKKQKSSGYDLEGYVKKYGPPDQSKGQHLTDEFKLQNHITFSTDSKYSTPDKEGGAWKKENGKWHFYASPFNLTQHSPEKLTDYFKNREPDSVLHLPNQNKSESPIDQTQIKWDQAIKADEIAWD